jgi:ABC-2 type transport system permease protein
MMRYIRLYAYFLRFSFSRAMEFRFDFYFRVAMDVVFYAVNIAFFEVIYLHTPFLGGWNLDQIMIFTAAFLFTDALMMTFFSNNFWMLPISINNGNLDYYLTRPVSSLFFLTFRDFAANSFLNLIIACGILAWAVARYPAALGAMNIAIFVGLLVLGNALHAMLNLIFIIPVFWLHGGMGLRELYFGLTPYLERPHQIFAPWLRRILTSILPMAMIVSVPTHVLFEGPLARLILPMLAVVFLVFLFLIWFWRLGLRSYSSASS